MNYIHSWFFVDVFSGIPFAAIELTLIGGAATKEVTTARGDGADVQKFKILKAIKLLRFLKLGRLLKVEKILSNLDRDTMDLIAEFLQQGTTRTMVLTFYLTISLCYACHIMACGFVVAGRAGSHQGIVNWLENEIRGPFEALDTTGRGDRGDDAVYSIYIAAFYMAITSTTSIGFGDVIPANNLERVYVVFMEIVGAILFATIIANITAVVTSMDVNARLRSEQLDSVSSFVAHRRFPTILSRRIRRHFRRFYENKSAIDETKILNELSTSLRKEGAPLLAVKKHWKCQLFDCCPPFRHVPSPLVLW